MTYTIGSLFTGYGGLEMGVRAALGDDAELAWVSDIDPGACKIIAHHHPGVPNLGDITTVDWATVPRVDVLTGGSPCPDLSHAGRRAGMTEGTRSNLWVAMREAIATLRPRLVIWENVRGAYSAVADSALEPCPGCVGDPVRDGRTVLRALGRVLGDLSSIGYDARWHGLRAADVGAPHGRYRVFAAANPAGDDEWWIDRARAAAGSGAATPARLTGAYLPTPMTTDAKNASRGDAYRNAPGLRAITTLLPTPAAYDGERGGPQDPAKRRAGGHSVTLQDAVHGLTLLPTPAVNDMGAGKTLEAWDEWTAKMQARHGNGNGHGKSLAIEAMRLLPTPRATDGTKGGPNQRGSSGDLMLPSAVHRWGEYAPAIARAEQATGRPAPDPTEPTGKGGAPRLNPKFGEWMMCLPAGHITDVPDITRNEALKAEGNGVVPPQAAHAIRTMASWQ